MTGFACCVGSLGPDITTTHCEADSAYGILLKLLQCNIALSPFNVKIRDAVQLVGENINIYNECINRRGAGGRDAGGLGGGHGGGRGGGGM